MDPTNEEILRFMQEWLDITEHKLAARYDRMIQVIDSCLTTGCATPSSSTSVGNDVCGVAEVSTPASPNPISEVPTPASFDSDAKLVTIDTDGPAAPTRTTRLTRDPSRDTTDSRSAPAPTTAPTVLMATVDIVPVLAAPAATDDALDGQAISGVPSTPANCSMVCLARDPVAAPILVASSMLAPPECVLDTNTTFVAAVPLATMGEFPAVLAPTAFTPMSQMQQLYIGSKIFMPTFGQPIASQVLRLMSWPSFMGVHADGVGSRPWPWPSFGEIGCEFPSNSVEKAFGLCISDSSNAREPEHYFCNCQPRESPILNLVRWSVSSHDHPNGDDTRPLPWPSFMEDYDCKAPSMTIMKPSQWCSSNSSRAESCAALEFQILEFYGDEWLLQLRNSGQQDVSYNQLSASLFLAKILVQEHELAGILLYVMKPLQWFGLDSLCAECWVAVEIQISDLCVVVRNLELQLLSIGPIPEAFVNYAIHDASYWPGYFATGSQMKRVLTTASRCLHWLVSCICDGPAMRSPFTVVCDDWVLPPWDSGQQAAASYDQLSCANCYAPCWHGYIFTGVLIQGVIKVSVLKLCWSSAPPSFLMDNFSAEGIGSPESSGSFVMPSAFETILFCNDTEGYDMCVLSNKLLHHDKVQKQPWPHSLSLFEYNQEGPLLVRPQSCTETPCNKYLVSVKELQHEYVSQNWLFEYSAIGQGALLRLSHSISLKNVKLWRFTSAILTEILSKVNNGVSTIIFTEHVGIFSDGFSLQMDVTCSVQPIIMLAYAYQLSRLGREHLVRVAHKYCITVPCAIAIYDRIETAMYALLVASPDMMFIVTFGGGQGKIHVAMRIPSLPTGTGNLLDAPIQVERISYSTCLAFYSQKNGLYMLACGFLFLQNQEGVHSFVDSDKGVYSDHAWLSQGFVLMCLLYEELQPTWPPPTAYCSLTSNLFSHLDVSILAICEAWLLNHQEMMQMLTGWPPSEVKIITNELSCEDNESRCFLGWYNGGPALFRFRAFDRQLVSQGGRSAVISIIRYLDVANPDYLDSDGLKVLQVPKNPIVSNVALSAAFQEVQLHIPGDPGGSEISSVAQSLSVHLQPRLGDKPYFKEGGVSGTLYIPWANAVGRGPITIARGRWVAEATNIRTGATETASSWITDERLFLLYPLLLSRSPSSDELASRDCIRIGM